MSLFTLSTVGLGSSVVRCDIQACQAFRALKQDDPKGSHTLKRGDDVLMSHNSGEKSIYPNCNSTN